MYILFLSVLLVLNLQAAWTDEEREYYKKKYLKESHENINDAKNKTKDWFSEETLALFAKVYGVDALKRLNYITNLLDDLREESLYKKLSTIDSIANRIHFSPDQKHWKKENYWATPLETIGTNYGDTEDITLLKYFLMVKVGINPRDIELIKKKTPFLRKNKEYKENISLFYFHKESINPLVLDYLFRDGKIYKFQESFLYEYIKKAPEKKWDVILSEKRNNKDFDFMNTIILDDDKRKEIDIFY